MSSLGPPSSRLVGAVACLVSAACFGVMAVFAKLAYDDGASVQVLLLTRFGLAGCVLLAAAGLRGRLRGLGARAVVVSLAMGAVGYAAQAGLYFSALTLSDASQVALLFCLYPLLVMVGAVVIGRDHASWPRAVCLAVALAGVALVLGGAAGGGFDPLGALLAFGSAVVYAVYILVGDRVARLDPLAFTTLVCCGAFGTLLVWSAIRGVPDLGLDPTGWLWLTLIALISTVAAILLFFTGMTRVGPTNASLLSMLEPVVTVSTAAVVFSDSLSVRQLAGGGLVIAAVLLVQLQPGRAERQPPAALA